MAKESCRKISTKESRWNNLGEKISSKNLGKKICSKESCQKNLVKIVLSKEFCRKRNLVKIILPKNLVARFIVKMSLKNLVKKESHWKNIIVNLVKNNSCLKNVWLHQFVLVKSLYCSDCASLCSSSEAMLKLSFVICTTLSTPGFLIINSICLDRYLLIENVMQLGFWS